ncbi:hypothetical protein ACQQ2Q_08245 [Agrobacterium sp. ES01]|uniref:hypothetical protein n=1 Tax=Agrobacterium sp. ES01 TaxID=3420714 RepID=UPI003D0C5003
MKAFLAGSFIYMSVLAVGPAWAGDSAPLTFQATRNSDRDYVGDWRVRFGGSLPMSASLKLGVVATDSGALSAIPTSISASVGTLYDNSSHARRGARVQLCPNTQQVEASVKNIQPVWIGESANLELRQSIDTVIYGEADAGRVAVSANQQVYVTDIRHRMAVTAGARLASDQARMTATLRLEQKILDHWTVSADFAHGVQTNSAAFKARYAFNW